MMIVDIESIKYNPECDLQAVEQFGFIDLRDAWSTHTIPSNIDEVDVAYNEIEDPSAILGKPSDVFEAYRMKDAVMQAGATPKEGEITE